MVSHTYKTIDTPEGEYITTADGRLTVLSDQASVERLQAHAPELLAALEAMTLLEDRIFRSIPPTLAGQSLEEDFASAINQARAAIRAARGE